MERGGIFVSAINVGPEDPPVELQLNGAAPTEILRHTRDIKPHPGSPTTSVSAATTSVARLCQAPANLRHLDGHLAGHREDGQMPFSNVHSL